MKIIARLLAPTLAAFLLIWTVSVFAEYTRTRPITGGAAQQLTVTLANGGYNGPAGCQGSQCHLPSGIDASKIGDGSVSTAEFQFLNSVTSDVQAQINGKQASGTYEVLRGVNPSE